MSILHARKGWKQGDLSSSGAGGQGGQGGRRAAVILTGWAASSESEMRGADLGVRCWSKENRGCSGLWPLRVRLDASESLLDLTDQVAGLVGEAGRGPGVHQNGRTEVLKR